MIDRATEYQSDVMYYGHCRQDTALMLIALHVTRSMLLARPRSPRSSTGPPYIMRVDCTASSSLPLQRLQIAAAIEGGDMSVGGSESPKLSRFRMIALGRCFHDIERDDRKGFASTVGPQGGLFTDWGCFRARFHFFASSGQFFLRCEC